MTRSHRAIRRGRVGAWKRASSQHNLILQVARRLWRRRAPRRLVVLDEGVSLRAGEEEVWRLRWGEVSRIETCKRDLSIVDMICLEFTVESRQMIYLAHDEMEGFDELCRRLCDHFPGVPVDWWPTVAVPAFVTNHRVLYEKPGAIRAGQPL